MEIPPEERKRIYEEEKARIEAEAKAARERQGVTGVSSTNMKPTTAAVLCYVGVWITGLIFFLIEEKNRFVRFHAAQSLVTFGALTVAGIILGWIPFVGPVFSSIIGVIGFVIWILMMVKASNGEWYKLPWAGDAAERMISSMNPPGGTGAGPTEPRPPEAPPAPGKGGKSNLTETRGGRLAASIATIVWSVVLFVFFNFFNQYVAYYQDGIRNPVLTQSFRSVLPILNVTLILNIIGHSIAIAFDRYILRQVVLIVLNLFGLATVITFLSVYPFNFDAIPNRTAADATSIAVTVVLILAAIGLAVGALVTFIKLLINVFRGRTEY